MRFNIHVHVQSCPTLCHPQTVCSSSRLFCLWSFSGKNTGEGDHFLLQGIFPTQGLNPSLLHLQHWQAGSYHQCHLGSPGGLIYVYKFYPCRILPLSCYCPAVHVFEKQRDVCVNFGTLCLRYIWKRLWNMSEEAEYYLQQIKLTVLQCGDGTMVRAIVSTRILAVLVQQGFCRGFI